MTVDGDALSIDFSGTDDQVAGNVNCPLSVTRSACYFALRALLPSDVPANAGTYAALSIEAPEGSVVNAQSPAAVVAGNVETSQAIADTVLAALAQAVDLPAQGQGTMNNLIIGGRGWTYYETIGGGQGASSSGPGPSGVHVGMSNTLNTPIEALELEYPMRVERYELRDGSGGDGEHRGGDGVERAVRVLEPATLNLLTDRRRHAPEGREGGGDGASGENLLNDEELPPKASRDLAEGDVVTVRTPGGGGYGVVAARPRGRSRSATRSRSGSRTSGVRQTASASSTAARASSCRSPTIAPKPPADSIARPSTPRRRTRRPSGRRTRASGMRPACTARSSSTPGFHSVDGSSRPAGGGGRKRASTAFISPRSKRSGRPQTWMTIGAPGLATRPASRSASTMSSAKKNEQKPVTASKLSSA